MNLNCFITYAVSLLCFHVKLDAVSADLSEWAKILSHYLLTLLP